MAACLLYLIDCKRWIWLVPGTIVFLLSPAMLFRVHAHIALTTHAYILCALLLYIMQVRQQWKFWRLVYAQATLGCFALLTHPYLYAMVFPIFVAGLIDLTIRNGRWMKIAPALLISIVPVIILLWAFGYINGKQISPTGASGYGIHSMNLVAPFIGGAIVDIPQWRDISGMYHNVPTPYNATGGQYEGYNHLGLGVLIVLFVTITLRLQWVLSCFRRHTGLSILMLAFFCMLCPIESILRITY